MPRKKRPPKNRFWRRSKFEEDEFAALIRYYFHEILFGHSRNNYCFYFKQWHRKTRGMKRKFLNVPYMTQLLIEDTLLPSFFYVGDKHFDKKLEREEGKNELITRQRISNTFNRISQYLWENHIGDMHPSFKDKHFFDGFLDLLYEKPSEKTHAHQNIYDGLCCIAQCLKEGDITSSLMFNWLSERSKVIRGFKQDKFYLEFSRVLYICMIIRINKIEIPSIYSTKDDQILAEILVASIAMLLAMLEQNPL